MNSEEKPEFQRSSFLSNILNNPYNDSTILSNISAEKLQQDLRVISFELDILAQVCSKLDKPVNGKRQRDSLEEDEKRSLKKPKLDFTGESSSPILYYPINTPKERTSPNYSIQHKVSSSDNTQNIPQGYVSVFPPNQPTQTDSENTEEQPFKIDPSQYPDKVWLVKKCGLKTGIFYPPICTPSHMSSGETVYFYVLVPHRAANASFVSKYNNVFTLQLPNGVLAKCEIHCQVQNNPIEICIDNVDRPQKAVLGKNWWRFTFSTETRARLKKYNFTLTLNYFEDGYHIHTSNALHLKKRIQPKKKTTIFHSFNEQQIKVEPSSIQIPTHSIEKTVRTSSAPLDKINGGDINYLLNG